MKRRAFIRQSGVAAIGLTTLTSMAYSEPNVNSIKPKALKKGDTIAISAPAGAIFSSKYIKRFEEKLTGLGFKIIKGKTLSTQTGYLAGEDDMRAKELNTFFADPEVKAIFTMRGGWGSNRILDLLDYEMIKKNPKILMGYSDITSLILAINKKTGLITYHGPMGYSSWEAFSTQQVYDTLIAGKKVVLKNPKEEEEQLETLHNGVAQGKLLGGNLTVVCSLIGSQYEPDWKGSILFLEETKEEPYRIDRLLWQMKLAGVFDKVNGIVLGSFYKCYALEPERAFSLGEVFDQHFSKLNKPVYRGASFGHTINKFTLPIGVLAKVDADKHIITLLENPTAFSG